MGRVISVFLLVAIIAGGAYFYYKRDVFPQTSTPKIYGVSSDKAYINNWFPKANPNWQNRNSEDIYISAKSAMIADYDSGEILFAKNGAQQLPAASTIKIMTALVALENAKLSDKFIVSEYAVSIGENSMLLSAGEELTLEELLYGAMLVSGNDAAITIAEGIAGTERAFVEMMNEKAKEIGLSDTKYVNSTGLDEDGSKQYTTVYDMVTITRYAWENYPKFRDITSTYEKYITATNNHKEYLLYNDTNLLTSYPGVKGVKPGFTWDAGWCLVTYAESGGKKLLGVILGSEDRRGEMVLLLDYAFGRFGITVEHPGLDL